MRRWVLVVVLSVAFGTGLPARAGLVWGTVSGTVTDSAGSPLSGICVWVADSRYSGYLAETGADGTYRLTVWSGEYRVFFEQCAYYYYDYYYDDYYDYYEPPRRYLPEWYNNKPDYESADAVVVQDLSETSGIDAALAEGGKISGNVTDETGSPLSEICVYASPAGSLEYTYSYARTGSDGAYRVSGLRPGSYKLHFFDCGRYPVVYASEWYRDKPDEATADPVSAVADGETPGINAVLSVGGRIHGRITDPSGNPLPGICVSAVHATEVGQGGWGSTGEAGTYLITGLAGGEYKVAFADCWQGRYESEWYDDKPDLVSADPIRVRLGDLRDGIDAVLQPGPIVDLAIAGLSVESVPVETDHGSLPATGWVRDVVVDLANRGEVDSWTYVSVFACPRSSSSCDRIGGESVNLPTGESTRRSFRWNGLGTLGDVTVWACLSAPWNDVNVDDNRARIEHYVLVGGTGFGVQLFSVNPGSSTYGGGSPCDYYWW